MAGLAKSPRQDKLMVLKLDNKEFVKWFNASIPSDEFFEQCLKAKELFANENISYRSSYSH